VVYVSSFANQKFLQEIPKCVEFAQIPSEDPKLLAKLLSERGLNKILWECGPNLATSALKNGCIQETITFIAPKVLGGVSSMTPFADLNFEDMNEVKILNTNEIQIFNGDICIKSQL